MRTRKDGVPEEQRALAAAEDVFNSEGGARPDAADEARPAGRGLGVATHVDAATDPVSEAMCPAAVVDAIQRSLLDRCAPVARAHAVPEELQ